MFRSAVAVVMRAGVYRSRTGTSPARFTVDPIISAASKAPQLPLCDAWRRFHDTAIARISVSRLCYSRSASVGNTSRDDNAQAAWGLRAEWAAATDRDFDCRVLFPQRPSRGSRGTGGDSSAGPVSHPEHPGRPSVCAFSARPAGVNDQAAAFLPDSRSVESWGRSSILYVAG